MTTQEGRSLISKMKTRYRRKYMFLSPLYLDFVFEKEKLSVKLNEGEVEEYLATRPREESLFQDYKGLPSILGDEKLMSRCVKISMSLPPKITPTSLFPSKELFSFPSFHVFKEWLNKPMGEHCPTIEIRVSKEERKLIKAFAKDQGMNASALFRNALNYYLVKYLGKVEKFPTLL